MLSIESLVLCFRVLSLVNLFRMCSHALSTGIAVNSVSLAYHFKHGLICNSKQYYAMFKITKCKNCVVYLQFALIATNRLKPGKVLSYICLGKGRTRSAFSMLVEIAVCLLIVYRMATF